MLGLHPQTLVKAGMGWEESIHRQTDLRVLEPMSLMPQRHPQTLCLMSPKVEAGTGRKGISVRTQRGWWPFQTMVSDLQTHPTEDMHPSWVLQGSNFQPKGSDTLARYTD